MGAVLLSDEPARRSARMPSWLRLLPVRIALVVGVLVLGAGCSQAPPGAGESGTGSGPGSATGPPPKPGTFAEGTCWSGHLLGADPQDVLALSGRYDVPYLVTARAVADRPAFDKGVACGKDHALEVFKLVRLRDLEPRLADYATLLRIQSSLYATVSRRVAQGCMTDSLVRAAARTGLAGAVMAPVLPSGASIGWAPAAPGDWARGRRVFACTLTWQTPRSTRYRDVFTKALPVAERTCILSRPLVFVDCARRHDRERIAVIDARDAVAAGAFPGPGAIRTGPRGRFLEVPDARWARLDTACTAYLRSISTTKKLTGVANVDADQWPTPNGAFPIYCDADTPPDQESLVTQGSVYNR
jgi:hypothetical protein